MYIHEAIAAISSKTPYIARKAWECITDHSCGACIKVLPTDGPDCCIILSEYARTPFRGWQPQRGDLIADDWELVR